MTDNYCEQCTTVKMYDDEYRCMTCYRKFAIADKEDAVNQVAVAPALARIQELENENQTLKQKLEALMAVVRAVRNPMPVQTSQHSDGSKP
jgi:hypothetical protein